MPTSSSPGSSPTSSPTAPVDTLLFDFGGVIIHIDPHAAEQALRAFRPELFDEAYPMLIESGLIDGLETAAISPATFLERVSLLFRCTIDEASQLWDRMLVGIPPENIAILKALKSRYRLFLLSNTNPLHMDWIYKHLEGDHGLPRFGDIFERQFLSYELESRKPDPSIFRRAMQQGGLVPQRTLFIDDSVPNLEIAAKLGFQVYKHAFNAPLTEIPLVREHYSRS